MSRWFRFYDDALNDPKLLRLSAETFRNWAFVLCVASKCQGRLPPVADLAFYLRTKPQRAAALMVELVAAGLLDKVDDTYEPHNWPSRQYQSDSSKERVKRHRDKRASVGLTPQWTAPVSLRKAVYSADNFECVYCGATDFLSIDHRTSELNGGTHDLENLVTACRSCNGAKRDLSFSDYVTKSNIETLHGRYLKRPQITEQNTEQKDGASAPLALVPIKEQPDPERDYFRRVREVVGQKEGGPIGAKLLKAKSGKISLARSAIEQASEKQKPVEYIFAIINKTDEAASQRGMDPRL